MVRHTLCANAARGSRQLITMRIAAGKEWPPRATLSRGRDGRGETTSRRDSSPLYPTFPGARVSVRSRLPAARAAQN